MKILFVCLGNICRSPAAEAVFQHLIASGANGAERVHEIDSAGTSDWHIGEPPYEPMQTAARLRGVEMSALRARQFTPGDFDRFDLIIAMDEKNLERMEAQRPKGAPTPVVMFTDFAKGSGMSHVPDPYYTRDFDGALDLIEIASQGLMSALASGAIGALSEDSKADR